MGDIHHSGGIDFTAPAQATAVAAAYKVFPDARDSNPSECTDSLHRVTQSTASRPLQPERQLQLRVSREEGIAVVLRDAKNCNEPQLHRRDYTSRHVQMPDAQVEGLLTGIIPHSCFQRALRSHASTTSLAMTQRKCRPQRGK